MPGGGPPTRPIAIVCSVTPRSRVRAAASTGSSGLGPAGSLWPSVKRMSTFFFGGATRSASRPTAIAVTDVGSIVPGSAGRTFVTVSIRNAWSRIGGHASVGIIGEDNQADQIVATAPRQTA